MCPVIHLQLPPQLVVVGLASTYCQCEVINARASYCQGSVRTLDTFGVGNGELWSNLQKAKNSSVYVYVYFLQR